MFGENTVRLNAQDLSVDLSDHSMSHNPQVLEDYLALKIHHCYYSFSGNKIVIRGLYDRHEPHTIINNFEKDGKLFNYIRPTASLSADRNTLYINCFPGADYVEHYARLYQAYNEIKGNKHISVEYELPREKDTYQALLKTNIIQLGSHDTVILGTVEKFSHDILDGIYWQGDGDFLWKSFIVNGRKIALLGCKFSIWADISSALITYLYKQGARSFYYCGKLGAVNHGFRENISLVTGESSILDGKEITWQTPLVVPNNMKSLVTRGKHTTVPSILCETNQWVESQNGKIDFVDPEIGHMAKTARSLPGAAFRYGHLVSDVLSDLDCVHNLAYERKDSIRLLRKTAEARLAELFLLNIALEFQMPGSLFITNQPHQRITSGTKREEIRNRSYWCDFFQARSQLSTTSFSIQPSPKVEELPEDDMVPSAK